MCFMCRIFVSEDHSGRGIRIVAADCVVLNKTDFPPFLEMRNEKTYLNIVKEISRVVV